MMYTLALQERAPATRLREARRLLVNNGRVPVNVIQSELARSWLRCWQHGLQPMGRMPGAPNASGAQLARELDRQRELVAHARPVMEFLHEQTLGSDSMSILAGADGMLLHTMGDPQFMGRAERVALRVGATWQEQFRGTNAIGTALVDARAVVVHAEEHYLERNSFLTCAAVPIYDPKGHILGALDVSGDHRGYHRHTLALVRSAARMIEHRLFDTRHDPRQWCGLRLRFHIQPEGIGTVAEGLLAVTEVGQLAGANATALELLGLDWQSLSHTSVSAVLAETMTQLLDWGRRASNSPHVVHTRLGHAVWVRVEAARLMLQTQTLQAQPATQTVTTVKPQDALAALDTGDSVFCSAITRARKLMGKPIAILLQGESGVGKEVFARAAHRSGPRGEQAFVAVNCAALPENLIEAELFGYQGGAFTGARREGAPGRIREAHGGTLFLDEIGDMPLPLQARLLRVLQERVVVPLGGGKPVPVDFCLVCATHRDLPTEMQAGRFREDLYYRLNGLTLRLPPLRERSDLGALMEQELMALAPGRGIAIAPDVRQALHHYRWPGNMRQLSNALRTACALLDDDDDTIGWAHLPDDLLQTIKPCADTAGVPMGTVDEGTTPDLRTLSHQTIERTVEQCDGNLSEAARLLGISRNTLYRWRRGNLGSHGSRI
ncbi:sigma-54-dependent Fis family transcriptional regulator [Candidatus Aalborgicola defluviihabitans]|jgi:transcriptional regulator of acetoin/glycerol metabolism|uniref:sigma-54-dependent Fis family transcriptional regulator n=1 Tax=Candidatus Aalborgicola defluviihabitans TaxID=3386187 RepID=UPI0039B8E931